MVTTRHRQQSTSHWWVRQAAARAAHAQDASTSQPRNAPQPRSRTHRLPVRALREITVFASVLWVSLLSGLLLWTTVPLLLGWHPVVVMSGSMQPRLRGGDVVSVEDYTATVRPLLGEVVLVADPRQPEGTYLHRLVEKRMDASYVTRGDANTTADEPIHDRSRVLGKGRLVVRFVGLPVERWRHGDPLPMVVVVLATWGALMVAFTALHGDTGHYTEPDTTDAGPA